MFRKFLISTALMSLSGAALAADLPARVAAPAPYIAAPMFTWTGFYMGLNAGASFNDNRSTTISTANVASPGLAGSFTPIYLGSDGRNDGNFTGGAQLGYNMQFGSFVAGVEADINYLRRERGDDGVFPAPADVSGGYDNRTDFRASRSDRNWFSTVRGRLGFAFDRALIYATGGLAFGGRQGASVEQRDYFENNTAGIPNGTFTVDPVRNLGSTGESKNVGWALGAGGEYAFTNNMSLKLEYLHVNFGSTTQTFTTLASVSSGTMTAGNTITIHQRNKFDLIRAGVNFRF